MTWRCFLVGLALALGACSSTPENSSTSTDPAGVEVIPGCEHAQSPEECRREHKNNGSDVPTVDHHLP